MKLKTAAVACLAAGSLVAGGIAFAQEHHEEHHEAAHEGQREAPRETQRAPAPAGHVRAEGPKFQAHPPGAHPHGAMVRSHPVRVLAPRVVVRGGHTWNHWDHPEFSRPTYYWDWHGVHSVTCTAEDSYGDQYPVTEQAWSGFGLQNMTQVEDESLDRCYQESGQDGSCYLATCAHF